MALAKLYQGIILEHNRQPRNRKRLASATHRARGHDASCGDDLLIELAVIDGRVREAAFSGQACAVTQAAASMLTEWLQGRPVDEVGSGLERFRVLLENPAAEPDEELGELNQLRPVGAFPARRRNALLPWKTALRALQDPGTAAS
ncbi:MAG: SUF system NifU family Fe-S cluster assembly protein [Wenzhouxiangella sp.]|nr:MAG: SUF system NifU family Fe-S cluster assembly protein [Wenzhouxiangella sp.]